MFVCVRVKAGSNPPHTHPPHPASFPLNPNSCQPTYLNSLHFQLHVILPCGLPIFPLLPAVAVLSVLHLLPIVQYHRPILRPGSVETGQREGAQKRKRWDEMRRIFRQSYSTAQGLILEMYKEARHESAPGSKCTSDLDDKTSLWCFSALVCTVWQWTKHPSAYISPNEKCVCCEQLNWQSFSESKLHEGQCNMGMCVCVGGASFLIFHSSNLNELWYSKSLRGKRRSPLTLHL